MTSLKLIIFLSILTIHATSQSQITVENEVVRFNKAQLLNDFELMRQTVLEIHPSIYFFINEDSLNEVANDLKNQIKDGMSELDFHLLLRHFIRNIRCGHTSALPSREWYQQQYEDPRIIPLQIFLIDDNIFVKESFDQKDILLPGYEILAINGISVKRILQIMRDFQTVDGVTTAFESYNIQKIFSTFLLFATGRHDTYLIDFVDFKGVKQQVSLKGGARKKKVSKSDNAAIKPLLNMTGSEFYILKKSRDLAYLDINSFSRKGFKGYYKEVFKIIRNSGIKDLVIDLRNNGGGYFPNGYRLLNYLIDEDIYMDFSRPNRKIKKQPYLKMNAISKATKSLFNLMPDHDKLDTNRNYQLTFKPIKKNAFKGNLYLLTNGGCFSMGALVPAKLKHYTNCIIIGSETGGAERGSNAILSYTLTLPETKIRIIIPSYFLNHKVNSVQFGKGVMPHIEIVYTLNDLLTNKDLEMERVDMLLKK